ncbi:serine/threonine-protein phosphatase [Streptomyces sp. N2-109]|uniref:Serine/threonine-protein phosphatase n=1 Tax=Streptomyces gossypii TaxID=2883101 RepID=A0ABT2JLB6_9ACTN|nr:PP2C family protein-serine/threonine phosphatase [Streptomyces gossypii]MCT2588673.1 serine/threonine-protein phosphatase [Streptomyces gossypii]
MHGLPGLWLLAIAGWQFIHYGDVFLAPLLAATPVIAAAGSGRRPCVVASGAWSLIVLVSLAGAGVHGTGHLVATCGAILAVAAAGYAAAGRRTRLTHELRLTREAATAAQDALLRPLPPRLGGLEMAAGHLSATRGATLGGDLYEAAATRYGVRLVIGDVRGHGLGAVSTVAAVLGVFREAAHDEAELAGVLRRLERGLLRHLGDRRVLVDDPADAAEVFVTVLLLEVGEDDTVTAFNCGHPWPYLLGPQLGGAGRTGAVALPVTEEEPMPPLGLFPLPATLPDPYRLELPPGGTLCLFTDGAQDARDSGGGSFPLPEALTRAFTRTDGRPAALVHAVRQALLGHTGGRPCDDAAVLVLRGKGVSSVRRQPVAEHAASG